MLVLTVVLCDVLLNTHSLTPCTPQECIKKKKKSNVVTANVSYNNSKEREGINKNVS